MGIIKYGDVTYGGGGNTTNSNMNAVVVSALPSDAASHPNTMYLVKPVNDYKCNNVYVGITKLLGDKNTRMIPITWNGLSNFDGHYIWNDGTNIYYSYSSDEDQYVLDKTTNTWLPKTWNGISDLSGYCIWSDGENIYYSVGESTQYVLDKATSTWSVKTWNGLTDFDGNNVWIDGENIYYSDGPYSGEYAGKHYVLDKTTSTWSPKVWNFADGAYDAIWGSSTWSDGENVHMSSEGEASIILDRSTNTWYGESWHYEDGTYDCWGGDGIWSDGIDIFYSDRYRLDVSTNTYYPIDLGITDPWTDSQGFWTDGRYYYYSSGSHHYVLVY